MRLLMLGWRASEHRKAGGAEEYTRRILEGLAARGHSVTWFSSYPGNDKTYVQNGVTYVHRGTSATVYFRAWEWMRSNPAAYDVIIDQINTLGFMTPLYARVPTVALIHQLAREVWFYESLPVVSHTGYLLEPYALRVYRHTPFVTVSDSTLKDLRALGWQGKGLVAHNGVEPIPVVPKTDEPTLVFLGRLEAKAKRLPHAVEAFRHIRRHFPTARLRVIGRGQAPPVTDPGITGIEFYTNVSDQERDWLLASSWILLATSVREGWGRMVLEAAAGGTPSVAYSVPGLMDAVRDGDTGILVSPKPEALATAAIRLMRDPAERQDMGRRAREWAFNFTWRTTVAEWETFLYSIANIHKGESQVATSR